MMKSYSKQRIQTVRGSEKDEEDEDKLLVGWIERIVHDEYQGQGL
jgi:hypothetical protein